MAKKNTLERQYNLYVINKSIDTDKLIVYNAVLSELKPINKKLYMEILYRITNEENIDSVFLDAINRNYENNSPIIWGLNNMIANYAKDDDISAISINHNK